MTGIIGMTCGICGSLALAPDEASQRELIRTHMLLRHPDGPWHTPRWEDPNKEESE